ncbi:C40 family peptidase [Streptomyces sp. CA2R106]|uniref:C40 family peptidase n=1 Tax=Streptomyces sp. CA2R106 TaxID=3120153 RepID=UPI003008D1DE
MKKIAVAALGGAILLPAFALLGFTGGGDQEPAGAIVGELDLSQISAQYQPWITKASATCTAVGGALLPAQIEQESGWNPKAQSSAGAKGLAQFIDGTWKTWGVDADGGGADVFDAPDAIMTMAKYDCWLAKKAQKLIDAHQAAGDVVTLMLAGYNAGPDAVTKYGGVPPYPETEQYVRTILAYETTYTQSPGDTTGGAFGARVVAAAVKQEGIPYSWGGGTVDGASFGIAQGSGTKGFDCSGLVLYAVYQASAGKTVLPHSSEQQATMGKEVSRADMQPGDVIAFQLKTGDYDHIGIYMGNDTFVEAPRTGEVIRESKLSDPYYKTRRIAIRRFG